MALERGGDINGVSRLGQTPSGAVATAVRQNKFEVLQFLIARGAALTALPGEAHGSSALHVAAAHGASSDIMRLIHHSGVPVDARDTRGLTPSMVAADSASASLGELIHLRADPSAVDADGRSLWQHAYVGLRQLPTVETMCPLPVAGGQASLASSRPEPYPWLEAVPRDSLAKIFPRCDVNIAVARRAHEVLLALEAILASETRAWQVGRADIQSDRALCRNIAAHTVLSSVAYTTQWNQRVRRADFRLRESGNEMYRERTWVTSSYTAFERLMRATRPCLIGPGTPPP
ncbi:MAG: hypothetical protein IPK85_05620 [Gemmatimonadetes bacterium]|nr:hypothetical protein [Gemmatimonadota bacterium]